MKQPGKMLLLFVVMLGLLQLHSVQAREKGEKYYKNRFDQFSRTIAMLKEADKNSVAAEEIELIRTWISQAQAYLAADKFKQIDPLLQRMAAQAEYVRALIDRVGAENMAQQAEEKAAEAEQKVTELSEALGEAEQRVTELESQGL